MVPPQQITDQCRQRGTTQVCYRAYTVYKGNQMVTRSGPKFQLSTTKSGAARRTFQPETLVIQVQMNVITKRTTWDKATYGGQDIIVDPLIALLSITDKTIGHIPVSGEEKTNHLESNGIKSKWRTTQDRKLQFIELESRPTCHHSGNHCELLENILTIFDCKYKKITSARHSYRSEHKKSEKTTKRDTNLKAVVASSDGYSNVGSSDNNVANRLSIPTKARTSIKKRVLLKPKHIVSNFFQGSKLEESNANANAGAGAGAVHIREQLEAKSDQVKELRAQLEEKSDQVKELCAQFNAKFDEVI